MPATYLRAGKPEVITSLLATSLAAQTRHLTGTMDIDIVRGILSGDVCLAGLPGQAAPRFSLEPRSQHQVRSRGALARVLYCSVRIINRIVQGKTSVYAL